jgi:D-alanyl-D-alanine carboxypeptidase
MQLPLAAAAAKPIPRAPVKKDPSRVGVETSAKAVTVVDWASGAPLFEKNADEPTPIASITKLMTALVVLDGSPDWQRAVTFAADDERPGGIPYLIPGEEVTVENLFNMSLIASANGATVALARSTGLSDEEYAFEVRRSDGARSRQHGLGARRRGHDESGLRSRRDPEDGHQEGVLFQGENGAQPCGKKHR